MMIRVCCKQTEVAYGGGAREVALFLLMSAASREVFWCQELRSKTETEGGNLEGTRDLYQTAGITLDRYSCRLTMATKTEL